MKRLKSNAPGPWLATQSSTLCAFFSVNKLVNETLPKCARQTKRREGAEHGANPGNRGTPNRPVDHAINDGQQLGRERDEGMEHHQANRNANPPDIR